jgi:hypothetical protein
VLLFPAGKLLSFVALKDTNSLLFSQATQNSHKPGNVHPAVLSQFGSKTVPKLKLPA